MRRLRAALAHHAPALAAAAAGLAWFLFQVGPAVLDPRFVTWLLARDWAASYVGWTFFRDAPLGFPLGANPDYPHPVGSTLGYSDSLPLLAVLLRPLAGMLPEPFQYVGPWLALAFALQGFAGAKVAALATPSRVQQALGGALFALSPVLVHRVLDPGTGHASLCGQFLVTASLWLALAPCADRAQVLRRAAGAGALLLAAAGLHPYLVVMTLALTAAFVVRAAWADRAAGPGLAAALLAGAPVVAAAGLVAFGYLGTGVTSAARGFGYFSADLLTLVNPMDWSRLLPGLPTGRGQYEGFAYLGAGVLALGLAGVAVALARALRAAPGPADAGAPVPGAAAWRRAAPAAVACAALAVLALTGRITLAGSPILEHHAYDAIPALAATFRSAGRFVWPLHLLVLAGAVGVGCAALRERPRLAVAALAAAVALQALDVRPPFPARFEKATFAGLSDPAWDAARGAYRHLALAPPFLVTGDGAVAPDACGDPKGLFGWDAYVRFPELARRLGLTVNSGYLARLDVEAVARACVAEADRLERAQLDPETIYVVSRWHEAAFEHVGAICGVVEGVTACVRGDRTDAFAARLRRPVPAAAAP